MSLSHLEMTLEVLSLVRGLVSEHPYMPLEFWLAYGWLCLAHMPEAALRVHTQVGRPWPHCFVGRFLLRVNSGHALHG